MATGRHCTACVHPQRAQIDSALVAGGPISDIADSFGLSRQAIMRHRDAHVPTPAMQAGAQAVAVAQGTQGAKLVQDATSLRDKALALLHKSEEAGDLRTALMGVREAARCLELMAKLSGDLDEGATVNGLVVTPLPKVPFWKVCHFNGLHKLLRVSN